jgi:cytochrome c peroxidase
MRSFVVIIILSALTFLFIGFVQDNPYFKITEKDVEFKVPDGFPKPAYNFKKNKITVDGFLLGRKLFYDVNLANDTVTSCSSCHQPFAGFAHVDHAISHGIHGKIGKRNVPTLQNLAWKDEFMADGGINNLDLQPIAPLTNSIEMGGTLEEVIHKLQVDSVYPKLFKNAFGDTAVTTERLLKSISQFLLLMTSSNSRYDNYLKENEKFTDQELRGLNIFRTKCVNCHKEPLFTDYTYRNIGLFPDTLLNDSGRFAITGNRSDLMKFKVPGLRNIEMTYPYMHDGRFRNLEEVMDHYGNGKLFTSNIDPLIPKITLTAEEKSDVIYFLRTLTDRKFLYDRRFFDPSFKRE